MSFIKKVAVHSAIQIIGKAIYALLGLCSLFVLTRLLGPDNFGKFKIIKIFVTSIGIIADMGIYLVALKELSTPHQDTQNHFPELLGTRIAISAAWYLLSPLIILFFPYALGIKIAILLTAVINIFNSVSQLSSAVFQTHFKTHFSAYAEIIGRTLLLVIVFTAFKTHNQSALIVSLVALIVGSCATMIMHLFFLKKYTSIIPRFSKQACVRTIQTSWPIALSILFTLIYVKADSIILSLFKPMSDVGLYGVPYRILETLTTIPIVVMGLFIPRLSAYWAEGNTPSFHALLEAAFQLLSLIAAPCIGIAILIASPFMEFVAGKEFLTQPQNLHILSTLFVMLMSATMIIFLGATFTQTIICINKQKSMLVWYIIIAVSALVAYLIFIPLYSYYAAATITILTEAGIAFASWKTIQRTTNCAIHLHYPLRIFLIAIGITLILKPLGLGLFPTIALYTTLYCAFIYLMRIPHHLLNITRHL